VIASIQPVGIHFARVPALAPIASGASLSDAAWGPALLGAALLVATAALARIAAERARASFGLVPRRRTDAEGGRGSTVRPVREIIAEPTAAQRVLGGNGATASLTDIREARGWVILDRAWIGYGERAVLRDVTLVVPPGELVLVIGPSGSGKTTLLRLISGSLPPMSGRVIVDGIDLGELVRPEEPDVGATIDGGDGDDDGLILYLTALENVEQAAGLTRWDVAVRRTLAFRAMRLVGLGEVAWRPAGELPGGQRQLISIARALAHEPRILLVDQPTAHLDKHTGAPLLRVFQEVARGGRTIMLTTHDDELIRDHHGMVIDLWEDRVVSYWQEPRYVSRSTQ
jgi:putative ABC transport system ATP-binding protein